MCRFTKLVLPFVLFLVSSVLLAGGPDCQKAAGAANTAHKKCNMSEQDCEKMMAEAKNRGWLGLQLNENEDGALVVEKVVPSSPAEKAGYKAGDVLLAINGVTLTESNEDKINSIRKGLKPGDTVTYNVRRGDRDENISTVLGKMPQDVYTAMVAEHMKEHTEVASK